MSLMQLAHLHSALNLHLTFALHSYHMYSYTAPTHTTYSTFNTQTYTLHKQHTHHTHTPHIHTTHTNHRHTNKRTCVEPIFSCSFHYTGHQQCVYELIVCKCNCVHTYVKLLFQEITAMANRTWDNHLSMTDNLYLLVLCKVQASRYLPNDCVYIVNILCYRPQLITEGKSQIDYYV